MCVYVCVYVCTCVCPCVCDLELPSVCYWLAWFLA